VKSADVPTDEIHSLDIQLTNIYKEYYDQRAKKRISDSEHLFLLASSEIKEQYMDQTGAFYAIIEREGHKEVLNMDYQDFDLFLSNIFYKSENKVLTKDTSNNTKRLLKSFTKDKKTLYNRVARFGDTIWYDLCNEACSCVRVTKEGSDIIENPGIFRRISRDRAQVFPKWASNKRYLKNEIFDKSTIKNDYQKLIAEIYVLSLFISDIAHPIIIPIGPKGSGKSLLLRLIALIVDPREEINALVQRLPREEKDRRVNIYNNYIFCLKEEGVFRLFLHPHKRNKYIQFQIPQPPCFLLL
jgi:hypothetical protein